jgi:hypothetical protein
MGEMRNAYKILFEGLKGRECLGDLGVNGRKILTNSKKQGSF